MSSLTVSQIKQYKEDGYIAPINVLSRDDADEIREEILARRVLTIRFTQTTVHLA